MARPTQILCEARVEAKRILGPLDQWSHQCHAASTRIVKDPSFPFEARVARGFCQKVGGQHSWVVLGMDCYAPDALLVDPTLWSYDSSVQGIWTGSNKEPGSHVPHGAGSIWEYGRPNYPEEEIIELTPPQGEWSSEARDFLDLLGPLDMKGWVELAHYPVEGWPAREIIEAINEKWPARVPIDILGMVTDLNPSGLYLRDEAKV